MPQYEIPRQWYVYTYATQDDIIFYVGKGMNGRIFEHEKEASRGCTCAKCEMIRSIWSKGQVIRKRIVFETLSEDEALSVESGLIEKHKSSLKNASLRKEYRKKRVPQEKSSKVVLLHAPELEDEWSDEYHKKILAESEKLFESLGYRKITTAEMW